MHRDERIALAEQQHQKMIDLHATVDRHGNPEPIFQTERRLCPINTSGDGRITQCVICQSDNDPIQMPCGCRHSGKVYSHPLRRGQRWCGVCQRDTHPYGTEMVASDLKETPNGDGSRIPRWATNQHARAQAGLNDFRLLDASGKPCEDNERCNCGETTMPTCAKCEQGWAERLKDTGAATREVEPPGVILKPNKETEAEKQKYMAEMKKRDDIIMILCQKVQGMES